jgi:hypothetical protein
VDATRAREVFEARWREVMRSANEGQWARYDGLVGAGPTSVQEVACRTLRDAVQQSTGPGRSPVTLDGSLVELDRDGNCWRLRYSSHLRSGLAAAVGPEGDVLCVWVVPEG